MTQSSRTQELSPEARARVEEHLAAATGGAARVLLLRPLLGGACQDNLLVEVELPCDEGTEVLRLVLRSDALRSLPDSVDRACEFAVIQAAVAAGVQTPPARWPGQGLLREGAGAYFLEWRPGVAIGRKVVRDPELAEARARLPEQVARALAGIHGILPADQPQLREALGDPPEDPARAKLAQLQEMLTRAGSPRPALELALHWLAQRVPTSREVTLVHGDVRTGNLLVVPEGLSALLDWEFAHWGAPAEDLAWLCVRDWRFGRLDLPVGGFAPREPLLAAYAAAGGRELDPDELLWWEVLGNLRWAVGSLYQGERYLKGEEDLELIAIARRAIEMEYEALRLIAGTETDAQPTPPPPAPPREPRQRPDAGDLLGAVAKFVAQDLRGALQDKGLAFRALIAANLLQGVAGAARAEETLLELELTQLGAVLPELAGDPLPAGRAARQALRARLQAALVARLRGEALGAAELGACNLALRTVLGAQLAVSNPRFDLSLEI